MRITSITIYWYTIDRIYMRKIFTTGVIIPVIKKSTLDPNVVKNYRTITLSYVYTKVFVSFIIPSAEISDNQFGFRESRGTEIWRENLDWFTGQIERTITDISRLRRRDKYYFWHLYHS